jgi:hypothetical protein
VLSRFDWLLFIKPRDQWEYGIRKTKAFRGSSEWFLISALDQDMPQPPHHQNPFQFDTNVNTPRKMQLHKVQMRSRKGKYRFGNCQARHFDDFDVLFVASPKRTSDTTRE